MLTTSLGSGLPSKKWIQGPPWAAEVTWTAGGPQTLLRPHALLVPGLVPLTLLRSRGQGGGPRVQGRMGLGAGPSSAPRRAPHQPWHTASLSQEDRVTETDKSTCQEEALEKESLNSPSQEAQKGNCSRRRRRRHQPPLPGPSACGRLSFLAFLEHLWPASPRRHPTRRATVWPRSSPDCDTIFSETVSCPIRGGLSPEPPTGPCERGSGSGHPAGQSPGQCDHRGLG